MDGIQSTKCLVGSPLHPDVFSETWLAGVGPLGGMEDSDRRTKRPVQNTPRSSRAEVLSRSHARLANGRPFSLHKEKSIGMLRRTINVQHMSLFVVSLLTSYIAIQARDFMVGKVRVGKQTIARMELLDVITTTGILVACFSLPSKPRVSHRKGCLARTNSVRLALRCSTTKLPFVVFLRESTEVGGMDGALPFYLH